MNDFELVKVGSKWAIFDRQARVYYYGKKSELSKRLKELNKQRVLKTPPDYNYD